ncbi:Ribulose-phosphate 3-epimerase [Candidatus Erwinia haradaeae]|uniref:Ribulose-phosphate 3-epimerase n=1 Tax=Candidatus Erwinia haradaeae TaxID=1922217 RepID=A0A451D084_9GAMM|nr:ribulose-phosphate 3-epimerase [Candidatus Erwinia haradaeae]VFP78960.1 Ribulose-phosphate 3-epimerase [Candidatus Erwinia haradaeae]
MKKFLIAPSILSADYARLGEDTSKALDAGGDLVHVDIMDNHYVPNLTMGPMTVRDLRNYGITVPIDVHLMAQPVDSLIPDFIKAGANCITFHPETSQHIDRTLQLIQQSGCKSGLALNPSTSLEILRYVMDKIDIILLMSVNPGFSRQLFIPGTLKKLHQVRNLIDRSGYDICLAVDGGIHINNICEIANTGTDMLVVGSTIFDSIDYKKVISAMRIELEKSHYI